MILSSVTCMQTTEVQLMWSRNVNKLKLMDAAEMVSCVCLMTEAKAASTMRSFKITHNYRTCPICVCQFTFFFYLDYTKHNAKSNF
jgi:hypothetical protein